MSRRATALALPVAAIVGGLIFGWLILGRLASGGFVASSFAVSEDDSGVELLARARDAATRYDFTGEVLVEWRAEGRRRIERVPVREAGGVLRVGGSRELIGAGDDRLTERDGGWKRLWGESVGAEADAAAVVAPDRKYTLEVRAGPRVAGRGTTLVEALRGGRVCERFAVDDVTGLLLRREQLDRHGRPERVVGFTELRDPVRADTSPKATAPRAAGTAPRAISSTPSGFAAPSHLGRGFALTGRYRGADGSVQLFYSDGIYAASIFEQAGELDPQDLPDGATSTDFGGRRAESYAMPSGTIAVWAGSDRVYTLVSDAPRQDLDALMHDLPAPAEDDATDQMTELVLAPFRW